MNMRVTMLANLLKVSLRSILRNRTRSLLTSLGIIIGVSAVIVMVGIGQGAQAKIEKEFGSLGTNLIVVFPASSRMGGVSRGAGSEQRLTFKDVEALRDQATLLSNVSAVVRSGGQIIGGVGNWSTSIYGVDPEYFAIRDWKIADGEAFTERDVRASRKVCVLGATVAEQLFPGSSPVGETIRVRNVPFQVVGVLARKGQNAFGRDQDDVLIAPSTTVLYRLKGSQYIDMINASAVSVAAMGAAQDEMRAILRESQRLHPGEDDTFTIRNQVDLTNAFSATSKTLTILLGAIAAVSLVVGGIGIMNIMLVSVTERTREIGIRLSVGARSSDVLTQFLSEAVVLSLSGGVIGVLLAAGIAAGMNTFTSLTTLVRPAIVLLSVSVAAAIGVFFGFYPARKAALLDPIDALRHE